MEPGSELQVKRSARWLRGLSALLALLIVGSLAVTMRTTARDREEARRLVDVLALAPGMHVADVGAGKGEFTVALALAVGETGHVYATEIKSSLLDDIRHAASRAGVANVTVIEADAKDSRLAEGCCDAILIRRVYHHFTHPEPTNASLYRALRPGGRLVVVDFEPGYAGEAPSGVPENRDGHGVRREVVVEELSAAGFHVERAEERWSGRDFLLLFRKPPA